jgi:hypothetical protein
VTEESPSETYSIEYVHELQNMLNWNAAIVYILLAEAGGLVEVKREVLEAVDVASVNTQVSFDQNKDVYVIEGVYKDEV